MFAGRLALLAAALAMLWALQASFAARADAQVRAGAAKVDASWHVGASAGQYAGDCVTDTGSACGAGIDAANDNYDPTSHAVRRRPSYGIQSRLEVRAIVVDDGDGPPTALVKTDQYIPQDLLYRRAGQLIEANPANCGVTTESLTMTASHSHSSPMYSSSSWGVWAFQDVFDIRFYNYLAERIAAAVIESCRGLTPVRVGAAVGEFDKTPRHSFGPAVADDGTPAGYPVSETDREMTVIRFDRLNGEPLANIVNFSLHPEFLQGNDLISADYVGPFERMSDRATRALTIYTQGAVGTAEPERSAYHSIHERLEFTHKDYAQAEYGASLMSDRMVQIWEEVDAPGADVPFDSEFVVETDDRWYPGPFSHPYPGVSNCRSDKGLAGNPQLPVVGLPTCQGTGQDLQAALLGFGDALGLPTETANVPGTDPGLNSDDFQALGVAFPENYSAPSYTGLQEDIDVHLQGIRLGDIYLPVCSCEQWQDQSENIETRTDTVANNEWVGFDWDDPSAPGPGCTKNGDGTYRPYTEPGESGTGTWSCPNPHDPSQSLPAITDHEFRRMKAQINNPADGWNDAENAATAESEPTEVTEIKGNYTQDDDATSAALGYELTVPIGMANDYNGYIASYREYQRGDHYRKALTGWGPHSSDYMASRLVQIGRELHAMDPGMPEVTVPQDQREEEVLAAKAQADLALNEQRASALGETGAFFTDLYVAGLPNDGGVAEAVAQPADVERFGVTGFTWNGGSNFTDNPMVRVERRTRGGWQVWADQSGELPVTLDFPSVQGDQPAYLHGDQEWHWTAHFEAFVVPFDVGRPQRATPAGTYRFVVDGMRREDGQGAPPAPYHLRSEEFEVKPWDGITATGLQVEDDGAVSFEVGPRREFDVPATAEDEPIDGIKVASDGPAIEDVEIGPIDYPDTYDQGYEAPRFINHVRTAYRDPAAPGDPRKLEWFCFTCSFRPWLDAGEPATATVTFVRRNGALDQVEATRQGDRWVTSESLEAGEIALVDRGCVQDRWGNFNGARSEAVAPAGEKAASPVSPPGCEIDEGPSEEPPGNGGSGGNGSGDGGNGPGGDSGDPSGSAGGPGPGEGPEPRCNKIRGDGSSERLRGTPDDDCIRGRQGDDRIKGRRGDDTIEGDGGEDRVNAGPGDDAVRSVGDGNDRIDCGSGKDVAHVGPRDRVRKCEKVETGR